MVTIKDFGHIDSIYYACSSDENIRYGASSGGFIKSFLVYLLESGQIDSVIITRTGNPDSPLVPETIITNKKNDILSPRTNSVYAVNNALSVLGLLQSGKRYAFVGLPCQIKRLKQMQKTGKYINITHVIGLFCGHVPEREFTLKILKKLDVTEGEIKQIEYRGNGWEGGFSAHLKNGQSRFISLSDYWEDGMENGPEMCRKCSEIGKNADVCVCDPWNLGLEKTEKLGLSLVVCRTARFNKLILDAAQNKYINISPCSPSELVQSQGNHIEKKLKISLSSVKRFTLLLKTFMPRFCGAIRHPIRFYYFGTNLLSPICKRNRILAMLFHELNGLYNLIIQKNQQYRVHLACKMYLFRPLLRRIFKNSVLVWYWREDQNLINFGDYVTELLLKSFGYSSLRYCDASELDILNKHKFCLFMIGSELHKEWVDRMNIPEIYIWGAGKEGGKYFEMRDEPYRSKVKIYAVRGPVTVRQLGLDPDTVVGDPGFLMPLFYPVAKDINQNKITYIPHLRNRDNWKKKMIEVGAERYIDIFCSRGEFFSRLRAIVSSKFVLTNTLHTTIICQAYGVPYAVCLAEGDILDRPDKWKDIFTLIGIENQFRTVNNYREGLIWWEETGSKVKPLNLTRMLDSFPLPFKNKKTQDIIKKYKSEFN